LAPVVEEAEAHISGTWAYNNKYLLMLVAIVVAAAGIALAVAVYARRKLPAFEPRVLEEAWFYDAAAAKVVGGPGYKTFEGVAWADAHVVDGAVNGTATLVRKTATALRKSQGGFVRAYAAIIALGSIVVLAWFVFRGIVR